MKPKFKQLFLFEWQSLVAALGLMSRIPAQWLSFGSLDDKHHHRAQIWYPAVGCLLGGLILFITSITPDHWHDLLTATVILVFWTIFTGALHIDGLADSADAWVGGMGNRQRTLDIMKDPSSGPIAVTVVVLCLLAKFALITQLIALDQLIPLLIVPMLARAWLLPLLANLPYARMNEGQENQKAGMANAISMGVPKAAAIISFCSAHLIAVIMLLICTKGWAPIIGLALLSGATYFLIYRSAKRRLGGYTGDILGASIEFQELALLFALVLSITD